VAERLDALLSETERTEPTYLDFQDRVVAEETDAKQRKRVAMGIQIAHFPSVRTLEGSTSSSSRPSTRRSSESSPAAASSLSPRMFFCSAHPAWARRTWPSPSGGPPSRGGALGVVRHGRGATRLATAGSARTPARRAGDVLRQAEPPRPRRRREPKRGGPCARWDELMAGRWPS